MGFPRPRITETRGRIPRPLRGPKTSGPLSRVRPLRSAPWVAVEIPQQDPILRTLLRTFHKSLARAPLENPNLLK